MTNVMHKFFIYLLIYFCLTCFGLSFSPSSEADEQLRRGLNLLGMVSAPGVDTILRTIEPR
jgi:preprotein translocase subunit SecG